MDRDFVRGAGQLLVERNMELIPHTLSSNAMFYAGGSYGFEVIDGAPGETYTVDIRTDSGYSRQLTGVTLGSHGEFWINESELVPGESNFIRVKNETQEAGLYSTPVALTIDPDVAPTSENQIDKMSVSRVANDVIIRWGQLGFNGAKTKLYYDWGDGSGTQVLTPIALQAGATEYIIEEQALATECVSITGTQIGGAGESDHSRDVPLPPTGGIQDLAANVSLCDEVEPPMEPVMMLSDSYHHRDHLGNLRVVTDAGGAVVSAHDYYPFGTELFPPGEPGGSGGSRMRFTGHERDQLTGLDYMLARYYSNGTSRFLSTDPSRKAAHSSDPQSWNQYTYTLNRPTGYVDPDGRDAMAVTYPDYLPQGARKRWGHSGLASVRKNGGTRYYEYGRYGTPKGKVRRRTIPDLKMENGLPTAASMKRLLKSLSRQAGKSGKVEAAYFKAADADKVNKYAEQRLAENDNPDRESYATFSNNCATFAERGLEAGGVDTPTTFINSPGNVIEELQGMADVVYSYDTKTKRLTVTVLHMEPSAK